MLVLYDRELAPVRPLDHVIRWSYHEVLNNLTTGQMILPAGDPACAEISVPGSFVRAYDGARDMGYFAVTGIAAATSGAGGTVTYNIQGAESVLARCMLAGWHEIGGTDMPTAQVMAYMLGRQTVARFALGTCDFADEYQYNFEDTTVLESLLSLGEVLLDPYKFVFDSTVTPWTVSLVRLADKAERALVYGRGMTRIRRSVDGRIVTRLYGRGYGEGDNQMTIASVNGGLDYLLADEDALARYGGEWEGVHVDTRQTDPQTLKAHMRAILAAGSRPSVSYDAEARDLTRYTGEDWDDVRTGDAVLVLDPDLAGPVTVRCTERIKDDVEGDPGGLRLVLANSRADTAEEINEIRDKIGIHELYSQGATNMYSMQIADNADTEHPLVLRFYVPGNVLRINSCIVYWQIERFRTYATMAASGGGSTRTSEVAGGATVTLPAQTVSTGVRYSSQPMDTEGSGAGNTGGPKNELGGVISNTSSAGSHNHNMTHVHAIQGHSHTYTGKQTSTGIGHNHSLAGEGAAATGGIYSGVSTVRLTSEGTVENSGTLWTAGASTAVNGAGMNATGENGSHSHSFSHVHDMPHVHDIAHEHKIPAMEFELSGHSHSVRIPEHEHELTYGVYEGQRAQTLGIRVDGQEIPAEEIPQGGEIDVAKWLRTNDEGRVTRAAWHEIEFVPDGITRITADLFFQVFIQSRGAGDY